MTAGRFKIPLKRQKREELRALSSDEIRKKLYGDFDVKAPSQAKKDTRVFDPRSKIFSESTGSEKKLSSAQGLFNRWISRGLFIQKRLKIVLGIAPVLFLALLSLFLLFRKSSDTVVQNGASVVLSPAKQASQAVLPDASGGLSGIPPGDVPPRAGFAHYTIQACVYDSQENAGLLVKTLTGEGHEAYIHETMTSKGKKRYRVYVGRFGALEDAKRTLEIILKRFSDSFIRKISQ